MNDNYYFNVKRERPEEAYSKALDYFKGETLRQYASSKSMIKIQEKITIRALELLNLKKRKALILDAGTGPGFVAIYLKDIGYTTVAIDIIPEFLTFYDIRDLNPIATDMCFPPFKPNTFDAIISISAIQWIYKDINDITSRNFFISLAKSFERILKLESQIVIQFYPKNEVIMKDIGKIFADNTNLIGNFVIDNPNSPRKRKIYLILKKREINDKIS